MKGRKMMEEKKLPDEQAFPQFQTAVADSCQRIGGERGTEAFRINPATHNRPGKVVEFQPEESGIKFTVKAAAKKSQLSYTHETQIYLYADADPTIETLYLRIELWGDKIFRVRFSDCENPSDPFKKLPDDAKMLIGTPNKVDFSWSESGEYVFLKTSGMTIRVSKSTCEISAEYTDGTEFFSQVRSDFKAADVFDMAVSTLEGEKACFEALCLDQDEVIYGLGERFDSVVRNGRTVDFHNKDAIGTTSRRTYVNVPFFLSTKGYGLFLNSGAQTAWDIATTDAGALQFAVLDDQMDYFVIAGRDPKEILRGYCGLTGYSKMPPLWSFGLWMSRNSYTSWEVVDEIAEQVRKHDIPCDVIHLDTAWFNRDWNCDLKFSKERFPEPAEHIEKYRRDGFKISLWQYNFIPPNADNTHYQEAKEHGYLAKNKDGSPYQLPKTCQGSWVEDVIVDFSNPKAREWYGEKISRLIEMGVGAIKTDFGEGIPEEAVYDSIDGKYFHNVYPLAYNSTVFNATKKVSGENIVWARSGTAGSQRFPLHWGGDSQCTFEALAGTLRAALSIGMCGFPFFSHDIGGFLGLPTDELYVRWAQFGLFSSHSRCHGAGDTTYREPWRFSEEACDIFRKYAKLRYSLMPYIYEQAEECTRTGLPMVRALYLEYPQDRNVYYIDDEYLFGDNLLIAPVLKPLSRTRVRNVYLPKGVWFDYFTRERIESQGMWIEKLVDLETMPIYVKEGTTLRYCSADTTLQDGMGGIVRNEIWW